MIAPAKDCPRCMGWNAQPHPSHVKASGPYHVTGILCPVGGVAMKRSVKQAIADAAVAGRPARKRAKSKYAAKAAYLRTHGGWGWQYDFPKPWRGKQA